MIDHTKRREEIAEATWHIVLTQGVSAVSIRTVAAQAGISTGSLRHVFPTKATLLTHAVELVEERATERIQPHLTIKDSRALVLAVIAEVMPLDRQRQIEMKVSIALAAEAPSSPELRAVHEGSYQILKDLCLRLVTRLFAAGLTAPNCDISAAATHLHALVDGLAFHLLANPSAEFQREAMVTIENFIDSL